MESWFLSPLNPSTYSHSHLLCSVLRNETQYLGKAHFPNICVDVYVFKIISDLFGVDVSHVNLSYITELTLT